MSSKISLDVRKRTYARLIGDVQHLLNVAMNEELTENGFTRADLARIIGKHRSFVTRKLNGTSNMTFETFAEFAGALNRRINIALEKRIDAPAYLSNGAPATVVAPSAAESPESNAISVFAGQQPTPGGSEPTESSLKIRTYEHA